MKFFRKIISKPLSVVTLFSMTFSMLAPLNTFGLTGGPDSPQASGFTAGGTGGMVNPFTGDFSYNIPLLDVGGYPLNLQYAGGVSPEQEASWVGLGWNLDVGSINRTVRGIADDYQGEKIITEQHTKPHIDVEFSATIPGKNSKEIFGIELTTATTLGLGFNNYTGFSASVGINPQLKKADEKTGGSVKEVSDNDKDGGFNFSVPAKFSSDEGASISPSIGYTNQVEDAEAIDQIRSNTTGVGFNYSSREGAKGLSFSRTTGEGVLGNQNVLSSSTTIPFPGFATPTYTTRSRFDVTNMSYTFQIDPEVMTASESEISVVGGTFSMQQQKGSTESNRSYGYLYEGVSNGDNDLLDFNREKDGGISKETKNLPLANHTYDIYSVSGNGIGGAYRIFRDDIVNLGDDQSKETNSAFTAGVGVGAGTGIKFAIDVAGTYGEATSNRDYTSVTAVNKNPKNSKTGNIKQKVYFGRIGEMTPENDPNYFGEYLQGTQTKLVNSPNTAHNRIKRKNRTTSFTPLTAKECSYGEFSSIKSYEGFEYLNNTSKFPKKARINLASDLYKKRSLPRITSEKKGHHISEIRVANESGQRYIYGVPVYNKTQQEVSFALNKNESQTSRRNTGLATYEPNKDNTKKNRNGLDHYFQKKTVPSYANSYLLTHLLSHDYVDSDEIDGPSDGDLGNYMRFNYTKTSEGYKWRTPFQKNQVNYNDGLAGKELDDKGNYTYGEKELWYSHSIETRDYVVEFELEDRLDGLGVADENGGLETNVSENNKQKRIKEIRLYSKRDKANGFAEPLKTVHFDYDYSLCQQTPNSIAPNKGKLTLKKVWFTYGNSDKGEENPYVFDYGVETDKTVNPDYDKKSIDRWGCYKPELETVGNEAFPYTLQDKAKTDEYVAAYCMRQILTPNGGEINVHYESDDYAYVQNKKAMRMFPIVGLEDLGKNTLLGNGAVKNLNNKVYINLGEGIDGSKTQEEANAIFKSAYFGDMEYMQFRINAKITDVSNDNIPGYCRYKKDEITINKSSVGGNYDIGVIKLREEGLNKTSSDNTHPFLKNTWLFARLHFNKELSGINMSEAPSAPEIITLAIDLVANFFNVFLSFRTQMITRGIGSEIKLEESFVRLYEGDQVKLGGGHRVKAIVMFDRWDEMQTKREVVSGEVKQVAGYGQKYEYTTTDPVTNELISSGVAAYEPIIGGEENPWREIPEGLQRERIFLAPDKQYYNELPYGESFMPSASVGYSKVTTIPIKVESKTYDPYALESNKTGSIEEEFYTAYDFPTFISFSAPKIFTISNFEKFLQSANEAINPFVAFRNDFLYATQQYLIELNDMHGKPKSKKVLPDASTGDVFPISSVKYEYQTDATNTNKLDSNVPLVSSDLTIKKEEYREIGTTIDVCHDLKHFSSNLGALELGINIKIPGPPIPIPSVSPYVAGRFSSFDSKVTTKVVNRCGILTKTIVYENGQNITTSNLGWDELTGEVLLTSVENEFHDDIYNFSYPAHWAYEEMGLAAETEGFQFDNFQSAKVHLSDGDEIALENGKTIGTDLRPSTEENYCYYDADQGLLLNKEGDQIDNDFFTAKVVRSGKRNVASMSVGSVSMLKNPVKDGMIDLENSNVLNTGAVELRNVWKPFCNCQERELSTNPFIRGERGQLRVWKNWTYLSGRTQNEINGEVQIQRDGWIEDYESFWDVTSSIFIKPFYGEEFTKDVLNTTRWQFVTEIENYNPVGQEIENKDALERYSMALFGFGRTLPVGVSNNSKYNETGVDSFEDYRYDDCNSDHFSWKQQIDNNDQVGLSDESAHTGDNSLKVNPGANVSIKKYIKNCAE